MNEDQTYDVYYDQKGDFLEVSLGEPAEEGTTEEIESGVFITREADTKEVKNIGILDFKKRVIVLKHILKKLNISFPLDITLSL